MCGLFALPSDHLVTAPTQAHAAPTQAHAAAQAHATTKAHPSRPCGPEVRRLLAEVAA